MGDAVEADLDVPAGESGAWALRVLTLAAEPYSFAMGVDAPAPAPHTIAEWA